MSLRDSSSFIVKNARLISLELADSSTTQSTFARAVEKMANDAFPSVPRQSESLGNFTPFATMALQR
ncbi:MAG: hypothetical protein ABL882_10810 [Sphingopyxis sp.]